jgi:hypothetical protein
MAKMIKTILITMISTFVFSGCMMQQAGEQSSTRATDADVVTTAEQVTFDCFKQLAPTGELVGSQFTGVIFTKGICSGEAVAVSEIIHAKTVSVQSAEGNRVQSPLYADGQKILVQAEGRKALVGTIKETNKGTELIPAEGVSFEGVDNKIMLEVLWL